MLKFVFECRLLPPVMLLVLPPRPHFCDTDTNWARLSASLRIGTSSSRVAAVLKVSFAALYLGTRGSEGFGAHRHPSM